MKHIIVPSEITSQIKQTLNDLREVDEHIQKLHNNLQREQETRIELNGKLNGILTAVAATGGLDTTQRIELSEDYTTMSGQDLEDSPNLSAHIKPSNSTPPLPPVTQPVGQRRVS